MGTTYINLYTKMGTSLHTFYVHNSFGAIRLKSMDKGDEIVSSNQRLMAICNVNQTR